MRGMVLLLISALLYQTLTGRRRVPSNSIHRISTLSRGGFMVSRVAVVAFSVFLAVSPANVARTQAIPAGEYAKHFSPLARLSIAVAEAMPAEQYGFRPHLESMTFGELMSHIATTNYQFCAGLKDTTPPAMPSPASKDAIVKFLSDSFAYCSPIIA